MMNTGKLSLALIILISLIAAACTPAADDNEGRMQVTVSILPQKYFVERIAGDLVEVNLMVGPGESPHTYEPQPSQMRELSQSSIYFMIGIELEEVWIEKFKETSPNTLFISTDVAVEKLPPSETAIELHADEEEEDHDEHDHDIDTHIWLSPANAKLISQSIAAALIETDPNNEEAYQANLEAFLGDIDKLDEEIRSTLENTIQKQFIVFHPSWGYFAHEYGLEQVAIEVGGNEPSAQELAELISFAKENSIKIILASPEFNTKSAQVIAEEIDGEVVLISPLAENWLENMYLITSALADTVE